MVRRLLDLKPINGQRQISSIYTNERQLQQGPRSCAHKLSGAFKGVMNQSTNTEHPEEDLTQIDDR